MKEYRIGDRIRELRRQCGLTQKQTADALGVTQQAVCRWERNQALPGAAHLRPLASLLGTTADALLADPPEEDRG
ncbi:MAG: helix-turn-helix transcriptional regulator [Clostridia bacterium]|nr:helix-turn-helix transcriptional regulator [Clostridia bacterium]